MADSMGANASSLRAVGRELRSSATPIYNAMREAAILEGRRIEGGAQQEASWSKRIPGTIHASRWGVLGIKITAGGPDAPHAAPYENQGKRGKFKHPLNWPSQREGRTADTVEQDSRPFLHPAVNIRLYEFRAALIAAARKVIEDRLAAAAEQHEEAKVSSSSG